MKTTLKLKLPENLSEIPLKNYQKWIAVASKEDNKGTYFLKQKTIEIFCGVPLKFVAQLKHKQVESLSDHLFTVLDDENSTFRQRFTFKGKEWGFIPNFEELSSGEYFDASTYINQDWKSIHKAMAVLYRPVVYSKGNQYLIEEYETADKYDNVMLDLPSDIALGAMFFFINTLMILKKDLVRYLQKQASNPTLKELSQKDMETYIRSINLLDSTFSELKPSLKSQ